MADMIAATAAQSGGRGLTNLKLDYTTYLDLKRLEIEEQQQSRRYYHAAQWTKKQIDALNKRRQPILTFNYIDRKINAVIGLLEQQRQDPKAYPRTPKHEEGAEVATAVLRYVLDEQRWKEKSPICGLTGGVDGIGGIELLLEAGDQGDPEVGFDVVDTTGFFYDPRSTKPDFSDAGYMGIGKWADENDLFAMFPDKREEIIASADQGAELSSNPDSDMKWISGDASHRRIRLVDHWYKIGRDWFWCIYTGATMLAEGKSPFRDEKHNDFCKYIMFSANVDHDGDRYGFVRNLKSPQDSVNTSHSKAQQIAATRRILVEDGNGLDVEKFRNEMARPDGVPTYPHGTKPPIPDDAAKAQELMGQLGFLEKAEAHVNNFGFNPSLMGTGVQNMSGRAIALQQSAGVAELGPFKLAYKGWKLRVYRAIWNAVQEHWTAQRWIRVTDDEQVAQFFAINRMGVDQNTGQPAMINQLGALDVDIILDEGPDTVNLEADLNETLRQVLPSVAPMLTPQQAQAAVSMLISTSTMPIAAKQAFKEASQPAPPDPIKQKGVMLELQAKELDNHGKQADNFKKMADGRLSLARANTEGQGSGGADPAQLAFDKWKALLDAYVSIEIENIRAGQSTDNAAMQAKIDTFLGVSGLAHDQVMQLRDHAHQKVMLALQPQPAPAQAAAA